MTVVKLISYLGKQMPLPPDKGVSYPDLKVESLVATSDQDSVKTNNKTTNEHMHGLSNSSKTEYDLENKNLGKSGHNVIDNNEVDQMEPPAKNVKAKLFRFITFARKKMGFSHL